MMKIFLAGGSGAIGIPLVRAMLAAGHQVTALTRSAAKGGSLRALGASVAVADALDRDALINAVTSAHPTHVVHQLTALPKDGPRRPSDLEPTNRLRIEGTRNLLDAAIAAGAKRFLVGSFAILSPRGQAMPAHDAAAEAVESMETQVLEANARNAIEGIVLRYGMFYGLETPSTQAMIEMVRKRRLPVVRGDSGQLPVIHIDDAVSATVLALDRAPAGSVYDVVDDQAVSMTDIVQSLAKYTGSSQPYRLPAWLPRLVAPYLLRITSVRMPLSNAKAKSELGWRLQYPTMKAGMREMFHAA
jgi:nucleoside-diphosphate-sugar epimerase